MNERISRKLELVHSSGALLYPVRIKNRDTGRIAFRLSEQGNTKGDSIEVEDEQAMIDKVLNGNYMVRARTLEPASRGGLAGLYRLKERSIRDHRIQRD